MRTSSSNVIFVISTLCLFSIISTSSIFLDKRGVSEGIFVQDKSKLHKIANKASTASKSKSYTFPDYLNYVFPETQTCAYYTDLQSKFQAALSELTTLQPVLDSVPDKISGTFTDMKENLTEYNQRENNIDQLEQQIFDDTDAVIAAAPTLVTLTEKNSYVSDITTSLATVQTILDDNSCTFTAYLEDSHTPGQYLCVQAIDYKVVAVYEADLTDACKTFTFEYQGVENNYKKYCVRSSYDLYLTNNYADSYNVYATESSCQTYFLTQDTLSSNSDINLQSNVVLSYYYALTGENTLNAEGEASDTPNFTIKWI